MEADTATGAIQSLIQQQLELVQKALGIEPAEKQDNELALDRVTEVVSSERNAVNFYTKNPNIEELAEIKRYLAERRAEAKVMFANSQAKYAAAKARFICIMDQRRSTQERIKLRKTQK